MTSNNSILFLDIDSVTSSYGPLLKRSFWFAATLLILFLVVETEQQSIELVIESYALVILLLVPSWLWATQRIRGLPVVPAVALIDIMYIVYPVISNNRQLQSYAAPQIASILAAETAFCIPMTILWYLVARRSNPVARRIRMLNPAARFSTSYYTIALLIVFLSTCHNIGTSSVTSYSIFLWKVFGLRWFNSVRSVLFLMTIISCFTICLSIGQRRMGAFPTAMGLGLIVINMLSFASGLLLSPISSQFFACVLGYLLSRGRIPWKTLCAFFFILNLLQLGKGDMRVKHWGLSDNRAPKGLTLSEFPAWYHEWLTFGWDQFTHSTSRKETDTLLERMSITQMILLAQTRIPEQHNFLKGETYAIIPALLVPRWLNPDKPRSHEGQIILSVSMGLQQRRDTEKTYIAWGLLAESWANFGWFGPPLLGIVFGLFFGAVTRGSRYCPFASYRFLICVFLFFTSIMSTLLCASLLATTIFQTILAITLLCLVIMGKYTYTPPQLDQHITEWPESPVIQSPSLELPAVT